MFSALSWGEKLRKIEFDLRVGWLTIKNASVFMNLKIVWIFLMKKFAFNHAKSSVFKINCLNLHFKHFPWLNKKPRKNREDAYLQKDVWRKSYLLATETSPCFSKKVNSFGFSIHSDLAFCLFSPQIQEMKGVYYLKMRLKCKKESVEKHPWTKRSLTGSARTSIQPDTY